MSKQPVSRRHRKGSPPTPTTDLTVKDLLSERALCTTHELRVIAPALLLVLEKDAPARIELAGVYTEADRLALQEFIASDPLTGAVLADYFAAAEDDPVIHDRTDRHGERLDQGQTLSSLASATESALNKPKEIPHV